jgi:[ribosomal protein S5]-alanine N-acetyltransferase
MLRELTLEDAETVYIHFSDPAVCEFMDIEPCKNIEEAVKIISFHIQDAGTRWGIFSKDDHQFIGTCGYHCIKKSENEFKAEIGFDLSRKFWGQGFMREALMPVIDFGFKQMGLTLIEATVETRNTRSAKLLEIFDFIRADELVDNLYYYYLQRKSN